MPQDAELDIRATADRVVALLEQQRAREAFALLNREREGQGRIVQESLDRYVAGIANEPLTALRRPGAIAADESTALTPTLDRLRTARDAPRFPSAEEMRDLPSDAQRHDVYASIVAVKGDDAATRAMDRREERVLLGLRQENATFASATRENPTQARQDNPATPNVDESRKGTGVYDDRIVVLWRDAQGQRHLQAFDRSNTEPTAQYDHHAGADGRTRQFASNHAIAPRLDATEGYEDVVRPRKIQHDRHHAPRRQHAHAPEHRATVGPDSRSGRPRDCALQTRRRGHRAGRRYPGGTGDADGRAGAVGW